MFDSQNLPQKYAILLNIKRYLCRKKTPYEEFIINFVDIQRTSLVQSG